MKLLHRLTSISQWILRRAKAEARLDDELQTFLEMSAADKMADGVPADEARRRARLELGGVEQVKERVRTSRHGGGLDEIARDARYAIRLLVNNGGFTSVVVLTLALGIGANTAIFSLIDALMLRWLPVRNPQELLQVSLHGPESAGPASASVSYPIVAALARQRDIFSGVAGFSATTFDVGSPGSIDRVSGALVTGGYYELLGLNPIAGRLLADEDDRPGAPISAVISYGYWQREFAASPQVVGQILRIKGVPVTIVGVTPREFVGANVGSIAEITIPVAGLPQLIPAMSPLLGPGNFWLRVLARPHPGVSPQQANARLNGVWPHISDTVIDPRWSAERRHSITDSLFELTPGGTGWTYLRDLYRKPLLVLMGGVVLVLLIACANVATLLLARASARRKEVAVRLAIGASRGRVVRQFLIESTILSSIGAAAGVCLAWRGGSVLVSLLSTGSRRLEFDLAPNWHILAFSAAAAVVTAMLFGVAPAMQTTAVDPGAVLKEESRTIGSRSRLLPLLVSGQVALSLVLLSGAGVFLRTLTNLQSMDAGFGAEGVLLVELPDNRTALPGSVMEEIRRLPGVVSATVSTDTPLNGWTWSEPAVPAGQPIPERDNAVFVGAGPQFFSTYQIPLLSGREFTERDRADTAPVAIVNEAYAQRHLANRNAIGQHLSTNLSGRRVDLEIVGLARNTKLAGLRAAAPPTVYIVYDQLTPDFRKSVSVRAAGPLGPVAAGLRRTLQPRFPDSHIEVGTLSSQVADTIVQERMMATLAAGFAALALALACIGIYGLIAYNVSRRTREIGIRMALGAQARRVTASVVSVSTRLVVVGVVAGLPAVWLASRWTESLLFGVKPLDPVVITGAIVVLLLVGQVAAYRPASRASRVDPLSALRRD
jgi:predicted permease